MPIEIPGTITTISINGHEYTHDDWEANTPGVIGALAQDISDQIAALELVGTLTKAISGNTTLSGPESTNIGFVFTGTLSGNATITFAAGFSGIAQIENQTSGGFSLICGLAAGDQVTVPSLGSAAAFCDGTDFSLQSGNVRTSTGSSVVGALAVSGAATISGAATVTGALTASSTANIVGNTTIGGAVSVTSNATVGGTASVTGAMTVAGALTGLTAHFSGIGEFTGNLSGGGNAEFLGTGTFTNTINLSSSGSTDSILNIDAGASGTGDSAILLNSDIGSLDSIRLYSDATLRWTIEKDNTAESGSDTGSDLTFVAFSDAGGLIGVIMTLKRTGKIVLNTSLLPTSASGLAPGTIWSNSGVLTIA